MTIYEFLLIAAGNVSQQIPRKRETEKGLLKPLKTWIILSRNLA
jgi:hypothetical protein